MTEIILPGGATKKIEDKPAPSYDSLTPEQQAAVDALVAKANPEDHYEEIEFAFVVVKHTDGTFGITNDLNPPLRPSRTADENDYTAAFAIIQQTMLAQQTAALVQAGMMQQAAMMQQHLQTEALRKKLSLG